MDFPIDPRLLMSAASFVVTVYFWFVRSNRERPNLEFLQLSDFRAVCRRQPGREGQKRLCLQQLDTGGVLIVNHSTRQNSVVLFDCFLETESGEVAGTWGYSGEDKPPWNIGPESSIAFSPACFFDVPEDYEVPDDVRFRIEFITASGKRFSQSFHRNSPQFGAADTTGRVAA